MKTCSKCKIEKPLDQYLKRYQSQSLRSQCNDCARQAKREHYHKNKERYRETNQVWRASNKEHIASYMRDYQTRNKEKMANLAANYRASKREQTPNLSPEEKDHIEHIYFMASDCRAVSGEYYHVDHIEPISKGGLHHPDNLQVMHWQDNLRKGNRT